MKELNDVDYNPIEHIHSIHKLIMNSFTMQLHCYRAYIVTGQGSVTLNVFAPNRAIAITEAALIVCEKYNTMPFSVWIEAEI